MFNERLRKTLVLPGRNEEAVKWLLGPNSEEIVDQIAAMQVPSAIVS